MAKKKCAHYWKVNRYDVGVCKYCGEVKDFGALQRKIIDDQTDYVLKLRGRIRRKRGRSRKEA